MARDPNEFAYGFEPKEPEPIGECAWCGQPIYNEDHIYDCDVICPQCDELAYKGSTAVDYLIHLIDEGEVGSVKSFLMDSRVCEWTEPMGAYVRFYFWEDYDKWVKSF